jgi:hypothetical protein
MSARRRFGLLIAMVLCCLVAGLPRPAAASRAVKSSFNGCVVDGLLITKDGYHYTLMSSSGKKAFDPGPHEGKLIRLDGLLLPGDHFVAKPRSLKVKGKCLFNNKRFRRARAWANRSVALDLLQGGKLKAAQKRMGQAIAVDPGEYNFYLLRARILGQRGKIGPARRDIARAIKHSKDAGERAACRKALDKITGAKKSQKQKQKKN